MTKKELKKLVKSARKTLRNNIKLSIAKELKNVITQLGQGTEDVEKEINKGSKQLARKLSKKIKINEDALVKVESETKKAVTTEPALEKAAKVRKPKAVK